MFNPHPPAVHAHATPGAPGGVQAHSPLAATFHALAARALAGRGGRPVTPGAQPHAGASMAAMNPQQRPPMPSMMLG